MAFHNIMKITGTAKISIAPIFVMAGMISIMTSTVAVGEGTETTPTSNNSISYPSMRIEFLGQPFYRENILDTNITQINQTYATFTFSGNGSLTPFNTTQSINTISNGTGVISLITYSGYARETIVTEDHIENMTATFYEIVPLSHTTSDKGIGIVISVFQTHSTNLLAPLNGTIAIGIDNTTLSEGRSHLTLWRWEGDMANDYNSLEGMRPSPSSIEGESRMNATVPTMTNATRPQINSQGENEEEYLDLFPF